MSPSAAGKRQTFVKCTFLPLTYKDEATEANSQTYVAFVESFIERISTKRMEFDYEVKSPPAASMR